VSPRVFGRDDLGFVVLDLTERAVERGGLTRAGGAGNQDDAVGHLDQFVERGVGVFVHPHAAKRELHALFVEHTHHDPFAVQHGDHGDADVDLASGDLELDAAVLGDPFLGDVQPGHDLQTADDGRLEAVDFRRHGLRLQHAVDPVADFQSRRLRLDVDVAGPGFHGLGEDLVDQPDDRGLLGRLGVFRLIPLDLVEHFHAAVALVLPGHQAVDRLGRHAQVGLYQLCQLGRYGQDRQHAEARGRAHRVQGVEVEGVAGGYNQRALFVPERKDVVAVDQLDGEVFQDRQIDPGLGKVDKFESQ